MLSTIHRTIRTHALVSDGDVVIVAVSGGPDSMALLHALWELAPRLRVRLEVATVDHGLRPEARAEGELVRARAQALELPWHGLRVDVAAARRERASWQDAARRVRLEALEALAARRGAARVALAHQADDQAETVLFRVVRGTGLGGLAGIPYLRAPFIRPLLDVTRAEIARYVKRRSLPVRRRSLERRPALRPRAHPAPLAAAARRGESARARGARRARCGGARGAARRTTTREARFLRDVGRRAAEVVARLRGSGGHAPRRRLGPSGRRGGVRARADPGAPAERGRRRGGAERARTRHLRPGARGDIAPPALRSARAGGRARRVRRRRARLAARLAGAPLRRSHAPARRAGQPQARRPLDRREGAARDARHASRCSRRPTTSCCSSPACGRPSRVGPRRERRGSCASRPLTRRKHDDRGENGDRNVHRRQRGPASNECLTLTRLGAILFKFAPDPPLSVGHTRKDLECAKVIRPSCSGSC